MTTGLRLGEVLAIQVRDVEGTRLRVRHSWSNIDRLKGTKTGEERMVPLVDGLGARLLELARNAGSMGRGDDGAANRYGIFTSKEFHFTEFVAGRGRLAPTTIPKGLRAFIFNELIKVTSTLPGAALQ